MRKKVCFEIKFQRERFSTGTTAVGFLSSVDSEMSVTVSL